MEIYTTAFWLSDVIIFLCTNRSDIISTENMSIDSHRLRICNYIIDLQIMVASANYNSSYSMIFPQFYSAENRVGLGL